MFIISFRVLLSIENYKKAIAEFNTDDRINEMFTY